jgi:cold shock CspA family protein
VLWRRVGSATGSAVPSITVRRLAGARRKHLAQCEESPERPAPHVPLTTRIAYGERLDCHVDVGQDSGGKDVFVHAKTLERGGLSDLAEGQRVRMQIGQGQKGPEARSIELLD